MRKFIVAAASLALSATLVSGCAGNSAPPISAAEVAQGLESYRLGAGDKLRITVYNEPALTGEYNVTPAGAVAFPLIGSIEAGNRTIDEVTKDLTGKLAAGYVNDPRVSVEVLNYRPFYILGEVNKPGQYPYVAGMTVQQAVALAGGYTYRANEKTAFLRRQTSPGEASVELRGQQVGVLPGDTIRIGERYF
ncbi:polysaccharide biosynthesis/export family protein [Novosphingobium cyanobacteriorum]|uniref:Polysaccharide export protein n=1 Tax=Novosphingobium cyanobacteriorum TaxID=3024215 RepID=A0ABT6CHH1_9SPHN|nr:polysaccharide biosynthesis/export family protein [Novosphingobium cyanobacteriorum]MDF8333380.1 polysaccharide export protein [Novosphingobium cyanobacteriorum]